MLTFMRNKLVGVETPDKNTYIARGFPDDHIYSLEVLLTTRAQDMTIQSLKGHWNRYTTPDCPRAVPLLPAGEGLCLDDEDFDQTVHKLIGRKACRHFANLILECCDAVQKTRYLQSDQSGQNEKPNAQAATEPSQAKPAVRPEPTASAPEADARYQALPEAAGGFFIDLHVHTSPASPCATSTVEEMITEAKEIGLDAICLTDHNYLWDRDEVAELSQRHGLIILRGNEVTTVQGDMVVFGLEQNVEGIVPLEALANMVAVDGGFIIAAHPFRGFLAVGGDQLGLEVEKAAARPMFGLVNALEAMNSKVTDNENNFCARTAQALGLPQTGGSDAHLASEVGIFATEFKKKILSEAELIAALASGEYRPVAYRAQRKANK